MSGNDSLLLKQCFKGSLTQFLHSLYSSAYMFTCLFVMHLRHICSGLLEGIISSFAFFTAVNFNFNGSFVCVYVHSGMLKC